MSIYDVLDINVWLQHPVYFIYYLTKGIGAITPFIIDASSMFVNILQLKFELWVINHVYDILYPYTVDPWFFSLLKQITHSLPTMQLQLKKFLIGYKIYTYNNNIIIASLDFYETFETMREALTPNLLTDTIDFYTNLVINSISLFVNIPSTPIIFSDRGAWFLKFGFLFLFTTLFSLIAVSYLGLYGIFLVNILPLFLFWISSIHFLNNIFFEKKTYFVDLGKWFIFNINSKVNFELYIDYISISFTVLTLTIAMCVYVYCFSYFRAEPNVERLMLLINLFVISMVLLVSSGNFVVFFLGWELIGLTSFFLINFWSTRVATLKAAFKAFTFNKFSDVCILISVLLSYLLIGDFNIVTFNEQIHTYINFYINIMGITISYIELLSFFLIFAAFIKSAQFGTHIWLPDSMEAPVPASALIHSATLVSAGVFLLLRFSPLFELSTYAYYFILIFGSFTAFFGGLSAAYQSDIKRILAYSTISHCGFLMVCFCTSSIEYTLLYLYIHGFFKAAVFLCVGNVIRFSKNYQDFRRMGGFFKALPLEGYLSFICLINLSGLPFTLGFYIKHLLIIGLPDFVNWFVYLSVIGGAISGIVYSYRLYYYVFFDTKKAKKTTYKGATDEILLSKYYTNTTLASNIAICALMVLSYILSLHFFNININNILYKNELTHFSFSSSNVSEYFYPTLSLYKNISYVNWLIIFVIILTTLVKWRYTYNYHQLVNLYWILLNFIVYFYLFLTILC
jgi:NADH:ubiquinone oxidoreductase subunit 5 (subunit L)/multisubunit Na+/H+ antiporter MnhA subunit